jgi:hypothetical protein
MEATQNRVFTIRGCSCGLKPPAPSRTWGTQSIRLARAGHLVLAVEPDPDMRTAFSAASDAANWPRSSTSKSAWAPPTRTGS